MRISDWSSDVCSSDLHSPFETIKEQEDIADISTRGIPAFSKPAQIRTSRGRRDVGIARPVVHVPFGVVAISGDGFGRVDQAGVVATIFRGQRGADIQHAAWNGDSTDGDGPPFLAPPRRKSVG